MLHLLLYTMFVYNFCVYQQENHGFDVVDQYTVYTIRVTTNMFSGSNMFIPTRNSCIV